jgi:hypothetical protein
MREREEYIDCCNRNEGRVVPGGGWGFGNKEYVGRVWN